MSQLLRTYLKMVLEGEIARVPNQLMSINSDSEKEEENVNEFSSIGGGSIVGYSLPLGMNPDLAGRKKNRLKKEEKINKKNSWL